MPDKKKKTKAEEIVETNEISNIDDADTSNEVLEESSQKSALDSFLSRSENHERKEDAPKNKKKRKLPAAAWWVIIGTVVVLLIVTAIILLLAFPKEPEPLEFDPGTEMILTVDENKQHQATPKLNSKGELDNNSYGSLLEYEPAFITQIDIEHPDEGSYTIRAITEYITDEKTGEQLQQATKYELVGFEDISMQTGQPDSIANDCALIKFNKVASIKGDNEADYGFDKPRAIVKTQYSNGTFATITVGKQAPNQGGSYIRFGTNKTIYLVSDDQVDALLFSVLDLMPLEINKSATTVEYSTFSSITLSGTAFSQSIELQPNKDEAIDMPYIMTAPEKMFVSEIEVSYISGAVRGLSAQEAVCVNPSDSQMSQYGLKNPYAKLVATYPDETVTLVASKPENGFVNIKGNVNEIIYKIKADYVPWVSTSTDKLLPDVVLKPDFNSLSQIVVTDSNGTYTFDTTTTYETVDTTDGSTETVTTTTATYNGEELDSDNFFVFYQNLTGFINIGKATKNGSGTPMLTISLSYSTGRATDTIKVYATDSNKYIAELNSKTICLVSKNYCTNFSQCVQDLINGNTVNSY